MSHVTIKIYRGKNSLQYNTKIVVKKRITSLDEYCRLSGTSVDKSVKGLMQTIIDEFADA